MHKPQPALKSRFHKDLPQYRDKDHLLINYFHSESGKVIFVHTISGAIVEQFDGSPAKHVVQVFI